MKADFSNKGEIRPFFVLIIFIRTTYIEKLTTHLNKLSVKRRSWISNHVGCRVTCSEKSNNKINK